jgi:hypothetical protein
VNNSKIQIPSQIEAELKAAEREDTKIPYYPHHNVFSGGSEQSILLAQFHYWWGKMKGEPFYKYIIPPKVENKAYKPGDSWTEELGWSRTTFIRVRDSLGRQTKISENEWWWDVFEKSQEPIFITWWTRQNHVTEWAFNVDLYLLCRIAAYAQLDPTSNLHHFITKIDQPVIQTIFPNLKSDSGISGFPNLESDFPNLKSDFVNSETTQRLHEEEEGQHTLDSLGKSDSSVPEPEITYHDLGEDGDILPDRQWSKNDPLFQLIASHLFGTPRNLQGEERKRYVETVHNRALEDNDWRRWCIWQAVNNAKGKRVSVYLQFVANELDFEAWKRNEFKPRNEMPEQIGRGRRQPRRPKHSMGPPNITF